MKGNRPAAHAPLRKGTGKLYPYGGNCMTELHKRPEAEISSEGPTARWKSTGLVRTSTHQTIHRSAEDCYKP